jgi:UDP-GlcNAc:undecaprenyl-phosphate GlcNAc-1-phosphate transferase
MTGRSIYTTDRGHLHHCLLARSGSTSRTLVWIGLCCAITSIGGLVTIWLKNDLIAMACSLTLVGTLVATRVFGYGEFLLLSGKVRGVLLSLVNISGTKHGQARQATVRLQGSRPWELLWASLIESADKFSVNTIRLDVNMPAFHEGYHGSWVRPTRRDDSDLWRTEIPLHAGERVIGRLTITGDREGISACEVIERLMDLLQPFEAQMLDLAVNGHANGKGAILERTLEREATVTPNGSGTSTVVAPVASVKTANGRPMRDREFLPHAEVSKCAL